MKKEDFNTTIAALPQTDGEIQNARAIAVYVMMQDGTMTMAVSGNDGDLLCMSSIASQQSTLKMMGFIKATPPIKKEESKIAPQSGAQ